jgi:hypothetical protein
METTKEQSTDAGSDRPPVSESPAAAPRSHGRLISLPGLPALPSLPALPGLRQLSWLRPQVKLPSRERVLLYTGLGAMAAIELIDWPVAAAIAMATVLTSSDTRSQPSPDVSPRREETPPAPAAPAPSAAPKTAARRPRASEASE